MSSARQDQSQRYLRRRFRRRLFLTIASLGILSIGITLWMRGSLRDWSESPVYLEGPVTYQLEPGTTLHQLSADLERARLIDSATRFQAVTRYLEKNYRLFQAGTYRFEGAVTPLDVGRKMVKGEIYSPIVLTITVPEGFTLKALAERLGAHGVSTPHDVLRLARDRTFLTKLRVPSNSLEGFIYPATYHFHKMPSAEDALAEMVATFWKNLPADYESKVKAQGLSLTQAVTFASLIELETLADEERPLVSEVIWRRLKDKAPIGIDAALIYGIPNYDGDLKWEHLSDSSNPYNTRIKNGLPPTPIGSPSRSSLEAVLTPSNEGYYYYVLKPGTTRHHFSRSLKEHNEHVKALVDRARQNGAQAAPKNTEPSKMAPSKHRR